MNPTHIARISSELSIRPSQVEATAELLDGGATVPFIARYRKEATGSLDEVAITAIRDRLSQLKELDNRRGSIIKSLEERDLLRARLAQMNSELQIARVIAPETVPTDHIGLGTRAVFHEVEGGGRYEMTFVGPWDSDIDRGWFNYKAPLCQAVLGKRIGDTVEIVETRPLSNRKRWRVRRIVRTAVGTRSASDAQQG